MRLRQLWSSKTRGNRTPSPTSSTHTMKSAFQFDAERKARFPIRLLTIALVLTSFMFAWFTWSEFHSLGLVQSSREQDLERTRELRNRITFLDEKTTESTRMAVETGDPQWQKLRSESAHQLNVAIRELMEIAARSELIETAWQAESANSKLGRMERQAFDFIHQGQLREAKAVLSSPDYASQKRVYDEVLSGLIGKLEGQLNVTIHTERRKIFLSTFVTILFLAISLLTWLALMRDLRDWRSTLVSQRDFVLQVMNTMGQGLTVTDSEGRFEYVNPAYAKLLNRAPEDLIGKTPKEVTAEEDHTVLSEARTQRQAGLTTAYENRLRRSDGSLVNVLITGSPRQMNNQVVGSIAVITDLTERKRTEAVREKLVLQLQDALANVKTLKGLLPICASCKRIRDDQGYWTQIESYIRERSEAEFSHGLCPECVQRLYPDRSN